MSFFDHHPAICSVGAYMVFNAFVGGMPVPSKPRGAYRWFYRSCNLLAFNVGEMVRSRFPQTPVLAPEPPNPPAAQAGPYLVAVNQGKTPSQ